MANVRVRCRDFPSYMSAVYSNRRPPSLFGEHCKILQTAHMVNFEENVEEMVGTTREVAAGTAGWRQPAAERRQLATRRRRDGW